ncbi:hypothetical protein [Nonomuraea angiospora]
MRDSKTVLSSPHHFRVVPWAEFVRAT